VTVFDHFALGPNFECPWRDVSRVAA
jgi:hypothetical protein